MTTSTDGATGRVPAGALGPGRSPRPSPLRAGGHVRGIALLVALTGAAFVLASPIASATQSHYYAGTSFGAPGWAAGQLELREPDPTTDPKIGGSSLAVDEETGDVYVADTENHRVAEFDSAGGFIAAFGWGVADGSPELETCALLCRAGIAGSAPGQFEAPTFIAVDNSGGPSQGDVYVADKGDGAITKFDSGGHLLTSWQQEGQLQKTPVAEGTGDLSPSRATGSGNLTKGSDLITGVATASGAFGVGQRLLATSHQGAGGIEAFITAVGPGTLTISKTYKNDTDAGVGLSAEMTTVSNLNATAGSFLVGLPVRGQGLPQGSVITSASPGTLRLSKAAEAPASGVALESPSAPFVRLGGVAVGPEADLYVLGEGVFDFDPDGSLSRFITTGSSSPAGLGIDAAGTLFLAQGSGRIEKLGPEGQPLGILTPVVPAKEPERAPVGLAVSSTQGDLYVTADGGSTAAYSAACDSECAPTQVLGVAGSGHGAGLAIDSATGTLYATSPGEERIFVLPVAIEAHTSEATQLTAHSATLAGTVDPHGSELSVCRFEYGEGGAEGHLSVPCAEAPAQIGAGSSTVAVHADVSGLEGGATYRFRLHAANAHGDVKADEAQFTTLASPAIGAVEASDLEAGTATLRALVDPRGSETHYEFEWGPCSVTCATSPYPNSTPQASIGAGNSRVPVAQPISGLEAQSTYHFRVVATNALGATTSPEHTFIEQPSSPLQIGCPNEALRQLDNSTSLPDCRAYELVTPAKKNGSLIGGALFGGIPQVVPGGAAVISSAVQCLAATPSCVGHRGSEGEPYEFSRTPEGWLTTPLAPSAGALQTSSFWSYGALGGRVLLSAPSPVGGEEDFYAREPDGRLRLIGPIGDRPGFSFSSFPGDSPFVSTADFSHLVYGTARGPAWGFDPTQGNALYEYVGSGPRPQLVGVSGGPGSQDLISECGTIIGGGGATVGAPSSLYNSLSADGGVVFFTPSLCASGSGSNHGTPVSAYSLYERIDETRTLRVSASTPSTCTTLECQGSKPASAAFEGASQDGTFALFTSTQKLTDQASQDPSPVDSAARGGCLAVASGASGCNLYASLCPAHCEVPAQRELLDLSEGAEGTGGPRVQGVVALSPDGSHTYFVAKGVLSSGPNALGAEAREGAANLYLYERDQAAPGGRLSYVATLSPQDRGLWDGEVGGSPTQGLGVANVSPEGDFLVFTSHAGLTPDARRAEGPAQVYRFDARGRQMTRVSIGAGGYDDDGNSAAAGADASIKDAAGAFAFGDGPAYPDPTMSGDARHVFFESPVALTPGARSEVVVEESGGRTFYAQNIYEWEADGAGGCTEPGGCVSLLGDGTETVGGGKINIHTPELLGTDASGEDVFIAVADPLTWQDTDTQRDFYDVKVGGGFAPPAEMPSCLGDGCKGPATGPASGPAPQTTGASGPEEGPRHPRPQKPKHRKHKRHHRKKRQHRHHHQGRGNRPAKSARGNHRQNAGGK